MSRPAHIVTLVAPQLACATATAALHLSVILPAVTRVLTPETKTGGASSLAQPANRVSGSVSRRVVVFLDYQNVYHRAQDIVLFP